MSRLRVIGEPIVTSENEVTVVIDMASLVELEREYGENLFSPNIREYLLMGKTKSEKLKNKVYRSIWNTLTSISQLDNPKGHEFKQHNKGARLVIDYFKKIGTDGDVTIYDIGSLLAKNRGACDGCQTISIICDYHDENDNIPSNWDEKIIVLVIDTTRLHKDKLFIDSNVLDNDGSSLKYIGVIPWEYIIDIDNRKY